VEYQIRDARITDIERIAALVAATPGTDEVSHLRSTDLLRQLIYLPNASVLVAESRRRIVGASVLALRPSVSEGGFVGTIDLLVVDPDTGEVGIAEGLVAEMLRSARNKGCVAVEVAHAEDPARLARWESYGFSVGGPRLVRVLTPMLVIDR
jgi:N-acetylglutamate synthase-like GNAT family acetyltransferase